MWKLFNTIRCADTVAAPAASPEVKRVITLEEPDEDINSSVDKVLAADRKKSIGFNPMRRLQRLLTIRKKLPNPGSFSGVTQTFDTPSRLAFDGFKTGITQVLSPAFMISHTLGFASADTGCKYEYSYQAIYSGVFDTLVGTMNLQGSPSGFTFPPRVSAVWLHNWKDNMKTQINFSIQASVDKSYRDRTITLSAISHTNGTILGAGYLQSLTTRLAVGVQGMLVCAQRKIALQGVMKYINKDFNLYASVNDQQITLKYLKKISSRTNLGLEMTKKWMTTDLPEMQLIYDIFLRQSAITGFVKSDGTTGVNVHAVTQTGSNITFFGQANIFATSYQCGFNFHMGPE